MFKNKRENILAKKSKKGKCNLDPVEDFTGDLITALNKEHGQRVAYNLAYDESPTHVKRWISSNQENKLV